MYVRIFDEFNGKSNVCYKILGSALNNDPAQSITKCKYNDYDINLDVTRVKIERCLKQ